MSKPALRSYSRYAKEAASLFGHMIRSARIEQGITIAELSERAGVSPGLVHRIENSNMNCSLGAAFEVAAIVGVRLFDMAPANLTAHLGMEREKLALLPKAARRSSKAVKDDF